MIDLEERVKVTEWLEVNRKGQGFAIKTGKQLNPELIKGYHRFNTRYNGKAVRLLAHRAVAIAFIPNPENKPTVNHIDAVKINNLITNLEWATYQEQQDHARGLGLVPTVYGEDVANNRYKEFTIRAICRDMEGNMRNTDIVTKYKVDVKLPADIRSGKSWGHVTKEYRIPQIPRGKVSDNVVRQVCELLDRGYGVTKVFNSLEENTIPRTKIRHIKERKTYKPISEQYNFWK